MSKTNFKKPKSRKSSLGENYEQDTLPIENLHKRSAGAKERINIFISPEKKKQLKMWAAMHDKDMTTIILEGLELWKKANSL